MQNTTGVAVPGGLVSRRLQLARRVVPDAMPEDDPGSPPARSYELAVRILCPFCGSADSTAATPCCEQSLGFTPPAEASVEALPTGDESPRSWRSTIAITLFAVTTIVLSLAASLVMQWRMEAARAFAARDEVVARELLEELRRQRTNPHVAPVPPPAAPDPVANAVAAPAPRKDAPSVAPRPADVVVALAEPARVAAPPEPPAVPPLGADARWSTLRHGMSRAAVRAMFGVPESIRRTGDRDTWYYSNDRRSGWITFYDQGGPVVSWAGR